MGPDLRAALASGRLLLMDGACATELQHAGLPDDTPPEAWNLTHPDAVQSMHAAYVAAGADILTTNTFQSHSPRLAGLRAEPIRAAAVRLARAAGPRFVLASLGPGTTTLPQDCDGLLFETWTDPQPLAELVRRAAGQPTFVSITYRRTRTGHYRSFNRRSPTDWARWATRRGVTALGVNCGQEVTVADCAAILRRYRQETDLPLFARPNAGTPTRGESGWVYPRLPREMAEQAAELVEAGARLIGGCCGTSPEYIAALTARRQE